MPNQPEVSWAHEQRRDKLKTGGRFAGQRRIYSTGLIRDHPAAGTGKGKTTRDEGNFCIICKTDQQGGGNLQTKNPTPEKQMIDSPSHQKEENRKSTLRAPTFCTWKNKPRDWELRKSQNFLGVGTTNRPSGCIFHR